MSWTDLPRLGKGGRQGTVYDIVGTNLCIKIFHRGSANQRLQGMYDQATFLSVNEGSPAVPHLQESGLLTSGDPYIVMSKLPVGLHKCSRRESPSVIAAACALRPHDYIWTDVYNNAWCDNSGRVFFNEGGTYKPERPPYNGDYRTLGGR